MAASNADQPPPVDEAGEHAFFLEDESGSMQISVDSSHFHLDAGTAPTHPGWGPFRRTSNGSDSGWSNASDFTGITASTLDESPFTDDDDSLILPNSLGSPSVVSQSQFFFHGDSNVAIIDPHGDDDSLIFPFPPTSPSIVSQSHPSFHSDSPNVASEQTLTVPSNFYCHDLQIPQPYGAHYRPGVARRHSDSNLTAPSSQSPNLHRRRLSHSSLLTEQFNDMHVDGKPHSLLSSTARSPTPSPSEYPSPVNISDPAFLHVQHRIERRYSDSMGQSSHSRLLGMRYRNHSESHLGVQATLIHERNNSFAVPQEAMGTAENAVDLLQYNDFAGTGSALAPTSWPTPPLTLPPALNTGLSSQGEATWDRTVLPVEGISSTYLTAPASHVDMQPYNYSSSSPMYSAEVQHSEGPPPSEPLTDYSSPCNGFGLVGQSSDPRQPNYESLTLPNSQSSLNYDRHTTNPDQDQISFVFRERPPASYVPPSMDVDPPMPVPQVTPPTLPGAADSVAPGLIVSSQCNFPKHTRGERKPDPKALEKMRWKNKVASFFCYLCSPVRSFTIKSARDRHMRDKHSGAPPAACSLCGNPYRDQSSLQRHKRLHHGSNATVGKSRSSKKLVTRN